MHETSKSIIRFLHDTRYATRYFIADGIDIGAGEDFLGQYSELFPLMRSCKHWDLRDGNAEILETVHDQTYNFVYSSHCLEHIQNPRNAIKNWLRVLRHGGHLIVVVPDEDMYEQGVFPSTWNDDHKWTFTTCKRESWSPKSLNISDLASEFSDISHLLKLEHLDGTFRYGIDHRFDQTMTPVAECAIELILRKRTEQDVLRKGRYPPFSE